VSSFLASRSMLATCFRFLSVLTNPPAICCFYIYKPIDRQVFTSKYYPCVTDPFVNHGLITAGSQQIQPWIYKH
jgi:hypothetical protein